MDSLGRNRSSWSAMAWEKARPVYREILRLPFLTELASGTLSRERFMYYLGQDSAYLKEYGRAMAALASRFPEPSDMALFLRLAAENLDAERSMHDSFLRDSSGDSRPSPVCLLCSSHLWRQVIAEPLEVALASVLPCFVVYEEAGRHIYGSATLETNPYRDWIEVYGSSDFGSSTEMIAGICDRYASEAGPEDRERMTDAFLTGVRLEWMFWDNAYEMGQWQI